MDPLITLGAIIFAFALGLRIGYAGGKRLDAHENLKHNVLADEYQTLYEDMCISDNLLSDVYQALLAKDRNALQKFMVDYHEWIGQDQEDDNDQE